MIHAAYKMTPTDLLRKYAGRMWVKDPYRRLMFEYFFSADTSITSGELAARLHKGVAAISSYPDTPQISRIDILAYTFGCYQKDARPYWPTLVNVLMGEVFDDIQLTIELANYANRRHANGDFQSYDQFARFLGDTIRGKRREKFSSDISYSWDTFASKKLDAERLVDRYTKAVMTATCARDYQTPPKDFEKVRIHESNERYEDALRDVAGIGAVAPNAFKRIDPLMTQSLTTSAWAVNPCKEISLGGRMSSNEFDDAMKRVAIHLTQSISNETSTNGVNQMINTNAIKSLAGALEQDEFSKYDRLPGNIRAVLEKKKAEQAEARLEEAADAILAACNLADLTIDSRVSRIRDLRAEVSQLVGSIKKIEAAREHGMKTNNFMPLCAALGLVVESEYTAMPSEGAVTKRVVKRPVTSK